MSKVDRSRASPNHDPRPENVPVDMLIFHYTGMENGTAAFDRLCDPASKVSAHYLIEENGTIRQMVEENRRAWHAGVASWRGETDINGRSIGIELVNPGHEFGYRPFPAPQMTALEELAGEILQRWPIPARNVVGHSDVAPVRKQDPGELFNWCALAAKGIGIWPDGTLQATPNDAASLLSRYGYDISDLPAAITAFQRHFRPERITGEPDTETAGLLAALCKIAEQT